MCVWPLRPPRPQVTAATSGAMVKRPPLPSVELLPRAQTCPCPCPYHVLCNPFPQVVAATTVTWLLDLKRYCYCICHLPCPPFQVTAATSGAMVAPVNPCPHN